MSTGIFKPKWTILEQMAFMSSTVAAIVALLSYGADTVMFKVCIAILLGNSIALLVGKYKDLTVGIHICLSTHIFSFTLAPFIGIGGICDLIMFPVIYAWAVFGIDDRRVRVVYAVINTICILVVIYQLQLVFVHDWRSTPVVTDAIIVFGQMLSLFLIARLYFIGVHQSNKLRDTREELVKTKNLELQNYIDKNLQLQNFAHIASHELKSPIRMVSNYAGLLRHSALEKLSEKETEYLDYIQDQSVEMFNLTSDLLSLSKLSNQVVEKSPYNPQDEISRIIKRDFADLGDAITITGLPQVMMVNPAQFNTLVKNLIENAVKYAHRSRKVKVEIYGASSDSYHHIFIKDNGRGIPDDQKERVFLIFKRLQSTGSGTGIGLATCKMIAQKHGGNIILQDSPEGGVLMEVLVPKV